VLGSFGPGVMAQKIGAREVYRQSPLHGGTVHTLGGRAAAIAEIESLTDEVLKQLQ